MDIEAAKVELRRELQHMSVEDRAATVAHAKAKLAEGYASTMSEVGIDPPDGGVRSFLVRQSSRDWVSKLLVVLSTSRSKRGSDFDLHKERIDCENRLKTELSAILEFVRDPQNEPTPARLRRRFSKFMLWETLPTAAEQRELITEEFKPRHFAKELTCRKFGCSMYALKYSHAIVKKLQKKGLLA